MSEEIEWVRKRLTENRRDVLWGVVVLAFFVWLTASFINLMENITEYISTWALLPAMLVSGMCMIFSVIGMFFTLQCIWEALRKK